MNHKQLNYSVEEVNELLDKIDNIKFNKVIFMPVAKDIQSTSAGGDCSCIISKTNKVILIDTGASHSFDLIKEELKKNNVSKIDYMIISHYHPDHIQNLENLQLNFDMTNTIYYLCKHSDKQPQSEDYVLTKIIDNEKVYPNNNSILKVDDLTFTFCNCDQSDIDYYDNNTDNYNDYSLCCYCEDKNHSIFFAGDINIKAQDRLASLGLLKKVDILKIEHHACDIGVNHGYIKILNPGIGIVSDSDNKYSGANNVLCESVKTAIAMGAECYCTGRETLIYTFDENHEYFNGKLPINTVFKDSKTYHNLYIDKDYDGISNGSYYNPFRTIREALAYAYTLLPLNVFIKTKDGSIFETAEHLRIVNFYSNIKLENIKLRQLHILNSNVTLSNIEVYDSDNRTVLIDQSRVIADSLKLTGSTIDAASVIEGRGLAIYGSKVRIDELTISEKSVAIGVYDCSDVYIRNFNGEGNRYGSICLGNSTLGIINFSIECLEGNIFDKDKSSQYTDYNLDAYLIENDDLNDFKNIGSRYVAKTGNITQSLKNIPDGIGYSMVLTVEKQTEDGSLMQVIRSRHFTGTNETGIWVRTYNNIDNWSNWFKIL